MRGKKGRTEGSTRVHRVHQFRLHKSGFWVREQPDFGELCEVKAASPRFRRSLALSPDRIAAGDSCFFW